jgi:gliding motility-associated-like protein
LNGVPASNLENPLSLQTYTLPLITTTSFQLHVVNDYGCEASKTAIIKIFRILNMPGAFTPNGDGRNDIYRIPPEVNITLNDFSIYDRWGNKVFTTKNIAEGWNGTYQGRKAATGTYVFVLNGSDSHGRIALKGSFVLIR